MSTRSRYSNFGGVDEYLLALDDARRNSLARLREIIFRVVPQATEIMRYNMPYYEYQGMLCAFTAQTGYLSFYVLDDERLEAFKDELPGLSIGKGCIRFQTIADFPEGVLEHLLLEAVAINESR